jgi:hypothetical protein
MPKGALLHSHSGGIANTDWLINKASEYKIATFSSIKTSKNISTGN